MKAGIATRDITPPEGTPIAGNVRLRPSRSTHDPLRANSLYLEDGATTALLIAVDLCLLPLDFHHRAFGAHDDAGERLVRAALSL